MIKEIFNKMSSDEGNAVRYRIIVAFCFVIHSFYAILFGCVGVTELMIFNIVSSAMYFVCLIIAKNSRITILIIFLLSAEIMSHSLVCSIYLGFSYQFGLYSLAIIPVTYFMTFLDPAFKHPVMLSSVLAVINLLILIGSLDMTSTYDAKYSFPMKFSAAISRINVIFSCIILVSFAIMFMGKINYDLKLMKENNDKLNFLAYYDQLTGLRNRNHIRDVFEQYSKSTDPYCVILGDIDDFKHVNDTFGHTAGDDVLKKVSEIIKKDVGDKGIVCRWGGEEILIIVKGNTEECIDLNMHILNDIRKSTVETGQRRISVTMTFGLCDYSDAMDIEKLISLADKRLYIGKKNGKNQIVTVS